MIDEARKEGHKSSFCLTDGHLSFEECRIGDKSTKGPQWTRNGKSWRRFQAWTLEKVKNKKEVILEAQRDKKKVHFVTLIDICHLKNAELEPKLQKYKGRVVLRGDVVKDDFGATAFFYWTGLVCVPDDRCKNNGCYCKITRLRWTSCWCSICLYSGKIGGCSKFLIWNVQTFGYVFHDKYGQNHGQTLKIPWYFLNETGMVTHLPDWYGKDN